MTVLATVTKEEKDRIYRLNRRIDALKELNTSILDSNSDEDIKIKEDIELDLKISEEKKQNWWNNIVQKYSLPMNKKLMIIYNTCEIIETGN